MIWTPEIVVLLVAMAVASFTDVRDGKIPNWLTGSLIAVGVAIGIAEGQAVASLIGLLAAFALHFPLWILQIEKGGDAKLMMGVGALLGASFMVETSAWCAVLYLPVGLALLAAQGRLKNLVLAVGWTLLKARGLVPGERPPPTMLRTAPIIAAASIASILTSWFEFTF